jgi:hypothetical protein
MAIIRDNQDLNWEQITNRDTYLRNKDAPYLATDPVTDRDIRSGAEVVSRSGNVMPRAITRDKLGPDALIFPMNMNISAATAVQVFTGYDTHLNNYIYGLGSTALTRLNTLDLLAPYADGSIAVSSPYGGTVTDSYVLYAYQDTSLYYNRRKLAVTDFALTSIATLLSPFPYDDSMGIDGTFTFDGQYLNVFKAAAASTLVLDSKAEDATNTRQLSGIGSSFYQTFKTGPYTTSITRVGAYSGTGNATVTVDILDAGGSTVIGSVSGVGFNGSGWNEWNLSATVAPSTTYRLRITITSGGPVNWNYAAGDIYPDGQPSIGTGDFTFRVYTTIAGRTSDRIERYSFAVGNSNYQYIDNVAWPGGTAPAQLMGYDRKFFYGYNASAATVVKYTLVNGVITLASTQVITESVVGILTFNSFIYFVYVIGTSLVAVPVSI